MICYFDTSAFVPLLVSEPGSAHSGRLWNEADRVLSSRLLYVETAAALAQAGRMGRLDEGARVSAASALDRMFAELDVIAVGDRLVRRAAAIARDLGLRGYDAVHCAAAEQVSSAELVVASGDGQLLRACREFGLATADTNR
jgi:predicted nucleic acid-binding protein